MLWAFDPGFGNLLYTHMKHNLHYGDGLDRHPGRSLCRWCSPGRARLHEGALAPLLNQDPGRRSDHMWCLSASSLRLHGQPGFGDCAKLRRRTGLGHGPAQCPCNRHQPLSGSCRRIHVRHSSLSGQCQLRHLASAWRQALRRSVSPLHRTPDPDLGRSHVQLHFPPALLQFRKEEPVWKSSRLRPKCNNLRKGNRYG